MCRGSALANPWGSVLTLGYYLNGTPFEPIVGENKVTKFKVGDKVKITKNFSGHEFSIGEEVAITSIFGDDKLYYGGRTQDSEEWYFTDKEAEHVEKDKPKVTTNPFLVTKPQIIDVESNHEDFDHISVDLGPYDERHIYLRIGCKGIALDHISKKGLRNLLNALSEVCDALDD